MLYPLTLSQHHIFPSFVDPHYLYAVHCGLAASSDVGGGWSSLDDWWGIGRSPQPSWMLHSSPYYCGQSKINPRKQVPAFGAKLQLFVQRCVRLKFKCTHYDFKIGLFV